MATEIKMPQLGESVTEGTISNWLVAPGDKVNKYEPIAEVITDKVNAEIPSTFTGTIQEILVNVDDTVSVGTVICTIEPEGAEPKETVEVARAEAKDNKQDSSAVIEEKDTSQKKRYSPAVLRLAGEHNIDLERVNGSGKGGRITRKDLQAVIESGGQKTETAVVSSGSKSDSIKEPIQSNEKPAYSEVKSATGDIEIPVTGVRKAIAANMLKSKHEAPHAWLTIEVDVTNLVQYRNSVKQSFKEKEGYNLTFLPFFIKAAVEALKEYPQLNSMWTGDKIIQKKDINISLAVATEDALFVPVIKNADEKTVKGLAREITELSGKVRSGKLQANEMKDGTFTINNTGAFGSIMSTPIINHPQAAILSIESIVKRPVVLETEQGDVIAVRSIVNLCLSLDHRVLDGLVCGRFLAKVKENLENMNEKNTSIY
ncbi:branched-chain alpha-keto acid dehydrogenase subunit E2 [Alkalihalobacillus alcalophilus ATCC 27647 = CGMCC 1.3604]|uniref:Dihydrolipoamide acetyltransferase component of pyruvate dehydrogenase complex n=1 Tax=Alkalihalobacillus alcalophilus ATCC 27647 = CGMCC 1.3604 TaxID=1218173 RepID=A0A094WPF2_ALKAL|nr:dihydrolipoamide acetyltransferase family protein [Alkalihalobacillus alcalophilus]KGA97883.1 branched-chain alpha-keto acid dehydrogenase subunit E2 [Alkalihalobacillus alcalophilus ATCC 27647 = CGMCC 1.3604]MED1562130.1 dihydrolipoamide acetyltransferase family protein [Alkalihalobacillus alcalophilus]THG89858.1 branched-chain alpha-keto acid dehydrogenase subunit E2 [Alkalihalobacillus alcalophilus ATCC 27647 = CGMCC 1.3604]